MAHSNNVSVKTQPFTHPGLHFATNPHPKNRPERFLGKHVLGEFYDCENLPDTISIIQAEMVHAAELVGATVVQNCFHEFNPYGLSGVVVIAESHLAIHTWPEYRCASVDLFTCSEEIDPLPGFEYLSNAFAAGRYEVLELHRGLSVQAPADHANEKP